MEIEREGRELVPWHTRHKHPSWFPGRVTEPRLFHINRIQKGVFSRGIWHGLVLFGPEQSVGGLFQHTAIFNHHADAPPGQFPFPLVIRWPRLMPEKF